MKRVTLHRRPDLDTDEHYVYGLKEGGAAMWWYRKDSVVLGEADRLASTITVEVAV